MNCKLSRYKSYVAVDVRVGFLLTDKNFICNENEIKSRPPNSMTIRWWTGGWRLVRLVAYMHIFVTIV